MKKQLRISTFVAALGLAAGIMNVHADEPSVDISQDPLFLVGANFPPRALLNVSNDNQLFFNAYPEFADLTGDGAPERGYNHDFSYFGYFDSQKCYTYSTTDNRFAPHSLTDSEGYCTGSRWSGNFLNWLTMARIDTVRKILYGGKRVVDDEDLTVLGRTYLPNDAHSWVRYYDGDDIDRLTPFALPAATSVDSDTTINSIPAGSRNGTGDRLWIDVPGWGQSHVQLGDQVEIVNHSNPDRWMRGVVRQLDLGATPSRMNVQVTGSAGAGNVSLLTNAMWIVTNHSRRGVSFCNTTASNTQRSQDVTDPPLLRVASGNYSLWTANERWQCKWSQERNRTGHDNMRVGGLSFSNGNDVVASGIWANADNPNRDRVGLGQNNYVVHVEACVPNLIGGEDCQQYPNGNYKPVGLLQQFGAAETAGLLFGMMTGSYTNNLSGGVLRKNMGTFADEVDPQTGQFIIPASNESIVRSLDALRLYGYNHNDGTYSGAGDNCGVGVRKNQMTDGRCMNWGNPQAEIFAEALRYFAGLEPNSDFHVAGEDKLSGLRGAEWKDPVDEVEWCAPLTIVQFNASVSSFDDGLAGAVSGLPGMNNPDSFTNIVGQGEGINGSEVFVGGSNRLCNAETLGTLAEFRGLCPEAPNQDGTYGIAGLAHYAWTNDLRPDLTGNQFIKTFGVSLAPAIPRIEVPRPGETEPAVVILPACENRGDGGLRCALADFQIIEQDIDAGTGAFFIQWDVHEWGSDFDMDINGTLRYEITDDEITVTTQTWADSSGRATGFGYIISGTTQDGYHAHSGINNYNYTDPTGVIGCNNCSVAEAPTSWTYSLGGDVAELLREPLFYAAKWGGYDKAMNFPNNPQSWDQSGDGLPDNYVFAANPAALRDALTKTFQEILALAGGSSIATESSRVREGSFLYRAEFDSDDWTGNVKALDAFSLEEQWDAAAWVAANVSSRKVFTHDGQGGVPFARDMNSTLVRDEIRNSIPGTALEGFGWDDGQGVTDERLDDLIGYLLGETANHDEPFRPRSSPIGDIINSRLVFSGPGRGPWARLPLDEGGGVGDQTNHTYGDYIDCAKQDPRLVDSEGSCVPARYNTVFVGANAGMMHALDAETGAELFAYVPGVVQDNLWRVAHPDYDSQRRFFVDGQFTVADAFDGSRWRTILVGGLGSGGKGVFALDVTQPQNFSANDVLWEISSDDPDFADLGHVYGRPRIARLEDSQGEGRWVAIFGNGYGSRDERGYLYVVDLFDATNVERIAVPETMDGPGNNANRLPGGLSAPEPVNNIFRTGLKTLYAGDLAGNVWRFPVGSNGRVDTPERLFTDPDNNAITAAPVVGLTPRGLPMVFFGTGKLFEVGDNVVSSTDEPLQSFYGIVDTGSTVSRNDLAKREIVIEQGERQISGGAVASDGWYLDLAADNVRSGERVLQPGSVSFGRLFVRTYEPSEDPCLGGGIVRDYQLNAVTGTAASGTEGSLQRPGAPSGGSSIVLRDRRVGADVPRPPPPPRFPGAADGGLGPPDDEDDMAGDRNAWCNDELGLYDQDGNFNAIGTICDGRQSWRQVR